MKTPTELEREILRKYGEENFIRVSLTLSKEQIKLVDEFAKIVGFNRSLAVRNIITFGLGTTVRKSQRIYELFIERNKGLEEPVKNAKEKHAKERHAKLEEFISKHKYLEKNL